MGPYSLCLFFSFLVYVASKIKSHTSRSRINGLCLRNTSAANLLGLCAISQPAGFTHDGLPIGLQLIARPFEEARLLRLALAYEQATEWSGRHADMDRFD